MKEEKFKKTYYGCFRVRGVSRSKIPPNYSFTPIEDSLSITTVYQRFLKIKEICLLAKRKFFSTEPPLLFLVSFGLFPTYTLSSHQRMIPGYQPPLHIRPRE